MNTTPGIPSSIVVGRHVVMLYGGDVRFPRGTKLRIDSEVSANGYFSASSAAEDGVRQSFRFSQARFEEDWRFATDEERGLKMRAEFTGTGEFVGRHIVVLKARRDDGCPAGSVVRIEDEIDAVGVFPAGYVDAGGVKRKLWFETKTAGVDWRLATDDEESFARGMARIVSDHARDCEAYRSSTKPEQGEHNVGRRLTWRGETRTVVACDTEGYRLDTPIKTKYGDNPVIFYSTFDIERVDLRAEWADEPLLLQAGQHVWYKQREYKVFRTFLQASRSYVSLRCAHSPASYQDEVVECYEVRTTPPDDAKPAKPSIKHGGHHVGRVVCFPSIQEFNRIKRYAGHGYELAYDPGGWVTLDGFAAGHWRFATAEETRAFNERMQPTLEHGNHNVGRKFRVNSTSEIWRITQARVTKPGSGYYVIEPAGERAPAALLHESATGFTSTAGFAGFSEFYTWVDEAPDAKPATPSIKPGGYAGLTFKAPVGGVVHIGAERVIVRAGTEVVFWTADDEARQKYSTRTTADHCLTAIASIESRLAADEPSWPDADDVFLEDAPNPLLRR